jgi:hypothetical protein
MPADIFGTLALLMQAAGAILTGTVSDTKTGLPVPGVTVSLADIGRSATTDVRGRYVWRYRPDRSI